MIEFTNDRDSPRVFSPINVNFYGDQRDLILLTANHATPTFLPFLAIAEGESDERSTARTDETNETTGRRHSGDRQQESNTDSEREAILRELERSENADERSTATFVRNLLESQSAQDRAAAERLLRMLRDPEQRRLAISISLMSADSLSGRELAELFRVIDDSSKAFASRQITALIRNNDNENSRAGVRQLLTMLAAGDQRQRSEGRYMENMLNDPHTSADAATMLRALCDNPAALSGLIELRRDPDRQQTASDVLELVKSPSSSEAIARIIPLLVCSEINTRDREMTRQDGETLLTMLKGTATQRQRASNIVAAFETPDQIRRFLSVVEDPANRVAAEQLYNMLASDSLSVVHLTNLLNSDTGYRDCGTGLLRMLNSNDEQTRSGARRCLHSIHDVEELNAVVSAFEKPELRPGLRKILDGLESDSRADQDASHHFIEGLTRPTPRERVTAERLIRMLGGDRTESETARTIVTKLEDSSDRANLLALLNNPRHREAATMIVRDLNGTNASAAYYMLQMCDRITDNVSRLLDFYSGMERRADALLLLNNLNAAEIHQLLDLQGRPNTRAAADELFTMLRSGNSHKIDSVGRLLRNLDSINETDRTVARKQLEILGGGAQRPAIRTMMSAMDEGFHLRMVSMLDNPENRDTAQRLIALSERDSQAVDQLLLRFNGSSTQLKAAVDIITDRTKPHAAEEFRRLLLEKPGEAITLVRTMTENRELANGILGLLNDRDRAHEGVALLSEQLSTQERQALYGLYRRNPQTRRAAAILSEALVSESFEARQGALSTLRLLGSTDTTQSQRGEQFVEMLARQDNTRARTLLALGPTPAEMSIAVGALTSNDTSGINRLLTPGNIEAKRAVLTLLADSGARRRSAGQRILANLANPAERAETERLLAFSTSSQALANYVEATNPPPNASPARREAASELRRMLRSTERREAEQVANLMEVLGNNSQADEFMLALGSPGPRRDEARTILASCNTSFELDGMIKLKFDNSKRAAYNIVLGMLRSDNRPTREGARALVEALASNRDNRDASALIDALNNPATREAASQGLELARNAREISTVHRLVEGPEFHPILDDLHSLDRTPSMQGNARLAMTLRTPQEIRVFLDLQNNPDQTEAFQQVCVMLRDETQSAIAMALLRNLAQPPGATKSSALMLVRMLNEPEYQSRAELVLRTMSEPPPPEDFLRLLYNRNFAVAGDFVTDSMNTVEGLRLMRELSNMISSPDVSTRLEAERLMRMLNKREEQAIAMRALETRVRR